MNSLLRLFTLIVTVALSQVSAKNAYFIGNSLTDGIKWDQLGPGAVSMGDATFKFGRNMIPGAPLHWAYAEANRNSCIPLWFTERAKYVIDGCWPTAFANNTFDFVSFQPYSQNGENGDASIMKGFIDALKPKSPNVQVYIYAQYPENNGQSFASQWTGTGKQSKSWYENFVRNTRAKNPGVKPALMVPVGHVLYELDKKLSAGQIPGYNSIGQFYKDGSHASDPFGKYIVTCTFLATFFKKKPEAVSATAMGMSAAAAAAINTVIWDVVRTAPLVGIVDGGTSAQRAAALAIPRANTSTAWYTLSGRALPSAARQQLTQGNSSVLPAIAVQGQAARRTVIIR